MKKLLVSEKIDEWIRGIPGVEVVLGKEYLTESEYSELRGARVYNLCHSYQYQSIGYYVSLLAAARGHRPMPSVNALQDVKSQAVLRVVSEDLDQVIQRSLSTIKGENFLLSVYFGRNLAKRYEHLSRQLFTMFQAPMFRAYFARNGKKWLVHRIELIPAGDIPEHHREFVVDVAKEFFATRRRVRRRRKAERFDLAILFNAEDPTSPSDCRAIRKFVCAAEHHGVAVEVIGRESFHRIAHFDALFIRETTAVNHHTYRFAQKAAYEGLVVIDDPESIIRCTNKVYLSELFARHRILTPRTLVVHRGNLENVKDLLGFPCVLKRPDSSSSLGVVKVESEEELNQEAGKLLSHSELVIAQQFIPTDFDWRIGVLAGQPLFACKYYMAYGHWQITNWKSSLRRRHGAVQSVAVEEVPETLLKRAVSAAKLIGNGLYGVDLKQVKNKFYVIEVNDNPSIESGDEDKMVGDALYSRIMEHFLRELEMRVLKVGHGR